MGQKPIVYSTNILISSFSTIDYPVLADGGSSEAVAVVAIVKGTAEKIDFWIDVKHSYLTSPRELLLGQDWLEKFKKGSNARKGFDAKQGKHGWTDAILDCALEKYKRHYRYQPFCMTGVFGQVNDKAFWEEFERLSPNQPMAKLDHQHRADVAARCIKKTPFWKPRERRGYSVLMFEVEALLKKRVLVRAFKEGIHKDLMSEIGNSTKTNVEWTKFNHWKIASNSDKKNIRI